MLWYTFVHLFLIHIHTQYNTQSHTTHTHAASLSMESAWWAGCLPQLSRGQEQCEYIRYKHTSTHSRPYPSHRTPAEASDAWLLSCLPLQLTQQPRNSMIPRALKSCTAVRTQLGVADDLRWSDVFIWEQMMCIMAGLALTCVMRGGLSSE